MQEYPKISIITPSFNQVDFIEATIKSVINQNYPNLEYIIIDGGSTDGSVDIIKKYLKYISYFVSEPDNGQYNAINKGFKVATGDIIAWLCSDDTYLQGTLLFVGELFNNYPHYYIICGGWHYVDKHNVLLWTEFGRFNKKDFLNGVGRIGQPSTFWRMEVYKKIGPLSEEFDHWMDGEYFLRIGNAYNYTVIKKVFATYRLHEGSKTVLDFETKMKPIAKIIIERYGGEYNYNSMSRFLNITYVFSRFKHILSKGIAMIKSGYILKFLINKYLHKSNA